MRIGILALQGAFIEHSQKLQALGIDCFEIRQKKDLQNDFDGLILPGGESAVIGKLLKELDLFDSLRHKIKENLPVLATCSGLILLASDLTNDSNTYFSTMPIRVKRNAYGRQLGSFSILAKVEKIGTIPLLFIRAPYIEWADPSVMILASVNNHIVATQYKNQIGLAFRPELTNDLSMHRYFIALCKQHQLHQKST